jgi:hypothetical protein
LSRCLSEFDSKRGDFCLTPVHFQNFEEIRLECLELLTRCAILTSVSLAIRKTANEGGLDGVESERMELGPTAEVARRDVDELLLLVF